MATEYKLSHTAEEIDDLLDKITDPDQTFNPESENAQSGKAVAEAVANAGGGSAEKEWQVIEDITLTEAVKVAGVSADKLMYKEVHIEVLVVPNDTTITSQQISVHTGGVALWTGSANPKASGKLYGIFDVFVSPDKKVICGGTLSAQYYSPSGSTGTVGGYRFLNDAVAFDYVSEYFGNSGELQIRTNIENGLGVGTRIKVLGR